MSAECELFNSGALAVNLNSNLDLDLKPEMQSVNRCFANAS